MNLRYWPIPILIGLILGILGTLGIKSCQKPKEHKGPGNHITTITDSVLGLYISPLPSHSTDTNSILPARITKYLRPNGVYVESSISTLPLVTERGYIYHGYDDTGITGTAEKLQFYHQDSSHNFKSLIKFSDSFTGLSSVGVYIDHTYFKNWPATNTNSYSFLSLGGINYSKNFLTLYPENPKLVYGQFSMDSIRLDYLMPSGQIYKNVFDVNLEDYTYETDGKAVLHYKPREQKAYYDPKGGFEVTNSSRIRSESNLYITYNPFTKTGNSRIDYSLLYKSVGLYFYNQLNTKAPIYDAGVGIRIKLK